MTATASSRCCSGTPSHRCAATTTSLRCAPRATRASATSLPKRLRRELRGVEADVLLLGHTHRPMVLRLGALWIVNPGSVTGARPRDSHTCATLDLPGCVARFYDLDDGAERAVEPIVVGAAQEAPDG